MKTKTLDERIRAKALADYQASIDAAFKPVFQLFALGNSTPTKITGADGDVRHYPVGAEPNRYSATQLLTVCKEALIERRKNEVQDEAVSAFLRKVEELDKRVDDLRDEINY